MSQVFATRYFTIGIDKMSEVIGREVCQELTRENIWNCILIQSQKYTGFKFGVNSHQQALLVNDVIAMVIERNKVLKQDTIPQTIQ